MVKLTKESLHYDQAQRCHILNLRSDWKRCPSRVRDYWRAFLSLGWYNQNHGKQNKDWFQAPCAPSFPPSLAPLYRGQAVQPCPTALILTQQPCTLYGPMTAPTKHSTCLIIFGSQPARRWQFLLNYFLYKKSSDTLKWANQSTQMGIFMGLWQIPIKMCFLPKALVPCFIWCTISLQNSKSILSRWGSPKYMNQRQGHADVN